VFAGVRPVQVPGIEADYVDLANHTQALIGGANRTDAKAFAP